MKVKLQVASSTPNIYKAPLLPNPPVAVFLVAIFSATAKTATTFVAVTSLARYYCHSHGKEQVMNAIRDLRLRMGLAQPAFARLLGIKRSLLSMVEIGKRALPNDAWQRLIEIDSLLQNAELPQDDTINSVLNTHFDKEVKALENEKHIYYIKRLELEGLLAGMQPEFEKASNALTAIYPDMEIFANISFIRKHLDLMYDGAIQSFVDNHPRKQQAITERIYMYSGMMASIDLQIAAYNS